MVVEETTMVMKYLRFPVILSYYYSLLSYFRLQVFNKVKKYESNIKYI